MKSTFPILMVSALLAMFLAVPAFAVSDTYELQELGLELTIPAGYAIITRDTPAYDPVFSEVGKTKAEMDRIFSEGGIYLNAVSKTHSEEIVITMSEVDLTNFSVLGDAALDTLASGLAELYSDYGLRVSQYGVYHHAQAKFIEVFFTDTANTVHGLQYYTVYNGKAMNFTMRSYEGNLSSRQTSAIRQVVDSIRYYEEPPVIPAENTPAFTYTDTEANVSFTVPANWKQEALSKDREHLDVKFVSTKSADSVIMYGSTDMWEELSTWEKLGASRADINEYYFSEAEIAQIYNVTSDKVDTVTYHGKRYYKVEIVASTELIALDATVTMTLLIHIDNGWMYMFQFGGKSTHTLYSDFEEMLKSVDYPEIATELETTEPVSVPERKDKESVETGPFLIVVLILGAVAVTVMILVRRKKEEKEFFGVADSGELPPLKGAAYCRKCGQKLAEDSLFCHICGTKNER